MSVARVPKGQNSHANSLATLASSLDECLPQMISMELLERPSIEHCLIVVVVLAFNPSWMDTIISFLANRSLPTKVKEAEKVQRSSFRFWTDDRLGVHICDVFTLMMSLISLLSCMKGFMVVTLGEDRYPIEQ